jgi:hypothetical protein
MRVFIGVGTSANVHPAAGLLQLFADVKVKYFVDPTPPSRLGDYHAIADAACIAIPKIVDDLLAATWPFGSPDRSI